METAGRKIHGQAEEAREAGNFLKALELTDQAMIAYQEENDYLGFAEIQASRFITLKHLFQTTNYKGYAVLMVAAAKNAVDIARLSKNPTALALPLFNLGKAYIELDMFNDAILALDEAVDVFTNTPPEIHNRPAVIADIKGHLHYAQYKAGDKTALDKAKQDIIDLKSSEENKYNKDVWLSGAHMRIAEMLKDDNNKLAKEHLQKAKAIIDANPDLKLRKQQWDKLSDNF